MSYVAPQVDGDSDLDIIASNELLKNSGNGVFAAGDVATLPAMDVVTSSTPDYAAVGDMNNDGFVDIFTCKTGQVRVAGSTEVKP